MTETETTKCYCGHTNYCDCGPKESFEDYLSRLKERRDIDGYKYTDKDFDTHKDYIAQCCKTSLSVYKCLEFMWFAKEEKDNLKSTL